MPAQSSTQLLDSQYFLWRNPDRRLGVQGFLERASRATHPRAGIIGAAGVAPAVTPSVIPGHYTAAASPRRGLGADATRAVGRSLSSELTGTNNETSNAYLDNTKGDLSSSLDEEGQLQQEVEKAFSIFDRIYRHAVSPDSKNTGGSAGAAAAAAAAASAKALRASLAVEPPATPEGAPSNGLAALASPLFRPDYKAAETPSVLLTVLRDLKNAHVRTAEAWGPPLLLLLRQLPLLSATELQQTAALLAAARCRPPLLLQGLCEALTWRSRARQADASTVILFMDALRRLRYRPCASHDELDVHHSASTTPVLLSLTPQLKRNASALKPPEAAALAALLLRRHELDQDIAESLCTAVYGHLEGPTSVLLLQQQASQPAETPQQQQQQQQRKQQQQLQHMLQRQRERAASFSSLSWVLHLGRSLAAANLERTPPSFCLVRELRALPPHPPFRKRCLHVPNSLCMCVRLDAVNSVRTHVTKKLRTTLNKLGLAIRQGLQYYKPRMRFTKLVYNVVMCSCATASHQQHQQTTSLERLHFAEPSAYHMGILSAVSATAPTTPLEAAPVAPSLLNLDHRLQQREEQRAAATAASARAARLSSHHTIGSPKPLPLNSHLPPPLVVDVHKESSTVLLLEQQQGLPDGGDVQPDPSGVFMAGSHGAPSAPPPAALRAFNTALRHADQPAAALLAAPTAPASTIASATNVEPTSSDCVDPFLAAMLLQHLSHLQHKRNPELLSALLASVSAAAAKRLPEHAHHVRQHVQKPRHLMLLNEGSSGLARSPSETTLAEGNPATFGVGSCCRTSAATPGIPIAVGDAAPVPAPAAAGVTASRCTIAVGTHQLRECSAAFEAAATADAVQCWSRPALKSKDSAPKEPLSCPAQPPSQPDRGCLSEGADSSGNFRKSSPARGAQLIPTGQGALTRLKESVARPSLNVLVLSWPGFVSTYGQFNASGSGFHETIRNGSSSNCSSSNSNSGSSRKRASAVKGFVPAGAQVVRLRTNREVYFANMLRLWSTKGPPNLRRLRRRHLRKLTVQTRAKAAAAAAVLAASSRAAAEAATATCTLAGDEKQLFRDSRWRLARATAATAGRAAAAGVARTPKAAALGNAASAASATTHTHRRRIPTYGQRLHCRELQKMRTWKYFEFSVKRKSVRAFVCCDANQSALNSMQRWSRLRRAFLGPYQLASLLQAPPAALSEGAGSADGRLAIKATPAVTALPSSLATRKTETNLSPAEAADLLEQQVSPCRPSQQEQNFPLGISFALTDCSFPLTVDTGPLVSPSIPDKAASSLKKRIQQEHRRRLREAADAQEWLQKLHHQRGEVRVMTDGAAPAKTAGTYLVSAALKASTSVAGDAAPKPLGSFPSLCPAPPALALTAAAAAGASESSVGALASRKEHRDYRRLLQAIAASLAAAADMKILTIRIAAPFVQRFARLSACMPTAAVGAADLAACCTASKAALQTLGLRHQGFPRGAHLPRRRPPRCAPPELESFREDLLISLEASFRKCWPCLPRQEPAHRASELTCLGTPATGSERRKHGNGLQLLIPEAAYLYGVVLQALIYTAQEERLPLGLAGCWLRRQEQEQHVIAFCNDLRTFMSWLTSSAALTLNSVTYMLCAARCLHTAVRMGWGVEREQQLLRQLRHIQEALAASLRKSLARGAGPLHTGGAPREFFATLVALAMSSGLANGEEAARAAADDSARSNESLPSVVFELADHLQLPLPKLKKWVAEASAEERLLLQPRSLEGASSYNESEVPASLAAKPGLWLAG
ncbi:hypothetical protein ACSSS7_002653 [Eimeria intestinalis]